MIPAWRHAGETGDRRFLGEMMERVGVFPDVAAGRHDMPGGGGPGFLSPTLLDEFPWLALIRCVARRLRLQFEEARASHVHLVVLEQVQVRLRSSERCGWVAAAQQRWPSPESAQNAGARVKRGWLDCRESPHGAAGGLHAGTSVATMICRSRRTPASATRPAMLTVRATCRTSACQAQMVRPPRMPAFAVEPLERHSAGSGECRGRQLTRFGTRAEAARAEPSAVRDPRNCLPPVLGAAREAGRRPCTP